MAHRKSVNTIQPDTSSEVSWLLKQCKSSKFVKFDTSSEVRWLLKHLRALNSGLFDRSSEAKELVKQAKKEKVETYFDFDINYQLLDSYADVVYYKEQLDRLKRFK